MSDWPDWVDDQHNDDVKEPQKMTHPKLREMAEKHVESMGVQKHPYLADFTEAVDYYLAGARAALELAAKEADKSVKHCHCNLRIRSLASSGGSGEEGGT